MAKGKAKVNYLGRSGVVMPQTTPSWGFIYEVSTVKHPKYAIGDRVVLPDGREFRYAKSSGECASGQSCDFVATGFQSYSTPAEAAIVGDYKVVVTAGTHVALAKDALRGGYFVSWPAAKKDQFRGIIGNDVADANAQFTIYLDGPLTYALVAATTGLEVYENPFANVKTGSNAALGKAGVPATYVSGTGIYFWLQTLGMGWAAPQSDVKDNGGVGVCWRHDGSLQSAETVYAATTPADDTSQYAGHRVIGSQAGNGPLIMLK